MSSSSLQGHRDQSGPKIWGEAFGNLAASLAKGPLPTNLGKQVSRSPGTGATVVEDTASEAQTCSHQLGSLRHVMLVLWPFPAGLSED